jgi:hypothetical protein
MTTLSRSSISRQSHVLSQQYCRFKSNWRILQSYLVLSFIARFRHRLCIKTNKLTPARCTAGGKECIWAEQPRRAKKLRAPS